jgi:hypothetical protein
MTQSAVRIMLDIVTNGDLHLVERRSALKDLTLAMEKNSDSADSLSTYKELLPQSLLDLELTETEQSEIVQLLCEQIEREPMGSGLLTELLWAVGKSSARVSTNAFPCVLGCALERPLSGAELRQAILSLEDLSYTADNSELVAQLPRLNQLRSKVVASGNEASLEAIDSYFTKLAARKLPGL